MRVRQGGGRVRTSPRSRPCSQQQQQQQQQQAVYKIHEGKAPLVLLGGAGTGGFETGRNPMSMIGEKNAGGGGFRLIRHHSAVYEHDIRTNSSSLLRTVSELREELHLGLPQKKNNQKTALDVVSGFPAITTDANKKQTSCGTRSDAALKLFTEVSHKVPLSPGAKKARQLDGFVYKNYSLQNRRTLSFPVGKEYLINEYVGKRKGRRQQSTSPPPLPRSFSFTTTRLTETLTVAKDDTGGGGAVSCTMDFGAEVDRHSKMDLFLQAAFTVLTTVAGIFTVYIYMQFFMSSRHDGGLLHHQQEVPLQHESSFAALQEEEDLGRVSFFYYCNMLARVLFFPFLAVLIAVVCAIITTRAWRNFLHGDSMWSRFHDADTCSHCEEVEDSRMRIEQADEKVQRAQQAKQQFMAYVFHNIRVPFNAIVLGLGHMQASGDGEGPIGSVADKMDLVQMMLDCAETMTSVLDDVTDMGELEVGQMELHSDEFDILAVIKFLSWGLKDLLQQKEIAFNMDVDETVSQLLTSHFVLGDKQRIVQTLGNFLSNAVKFTPAGGKLDLKVHCEEVVEKKHVDLPFIHEASSSSSESVTRTEDPLLGVTGTSILAKTSSQTKHSIIDKVARIHISVKDNGIGISAEDQAKLFEPYSFVTSGWVQKGGVSGLGLSMAKHYVERVGGNIGVESSVGKGSTFFFSIPFPLVPRDDNNKTEMLLLNSEASESTRNDSSVPQKTIARRRKSMEQEGTFVQNIAATKPAESKQKDSGHRQRKVLLVEDTRINRIILRKVLQNLNLLCDEAENGKIAVDLHVQGNSYDLVLMDKEMPVMDGHEATRQLRLMGVKTPIIALTGNALQSDRELFFEAGVNDFQTKPLSRDKLVQLLIRHGVESSIPAAG